VRQEYLYVGAWLDVLPALERVRCTVGRLPSHPPRTEGYPYMFIIYQYFGQKSGSHLGNGAIVTKLFVLGAGFFQAVPLGSMLRNALDQMVIEGASLEARHRKR
jgi:hypothetical protein